MTAATERAARRLFIPSVVQTSALDCGPASLKAMLAGFGVDLDYGRLREACQTDIDGTSIDVIEALTVQLGFDASQYIVPIDHLLMSEADVLPGLVVTRQPSGLTHFVVLWRTFGRFVQVMDPGTGRVWRTRRSFLRDVFVHRFPASPELARAWLTSEGFLDPLRRRMAELGWTDDDREEAVAQAQDGDGWLPIAALDAATRLATRLVAVEAIDRGPVAARLVARLAADVARGTAEEATRIVPARDWSVAARPDGNVALIGAVIMHVSGPLAAATDADDEPTEDEPTDDEPPAPEPDATATTADDASDGPDPHTGAQPGAVADPSEERADAEPEATAVEPEEPTRPPPRAADFAAGARTSLVRSLLAAAFAESRIALPIVAFALLVAGAVVAIEALLLGGLARGFAAEPGAFALVLVFLVLSTLLGLSSAAVLLRLGRWLDIHLRIRLLEKLPRLGNYYFHSRLPSDLAHRAHELRALRLLPITAAHALELVVEVVLTTIGLVWLSPSGALPAVLAALTILGLPVVMLPLLREQELRLQTHEGALMRFYLDSLLGLTPIRTHCATGAVRAEHEGLLTHWARATHEYLWTHIGEMGVGMIAGTLLALWTIGRHIDAGSGGTLLLAAYWAFKLPGLAQSLALVVRQVPGMHNRLLRIHEVLDASEETAAGAPAAPPGPATTPPVAGVRVELRGVKVVAGGHRILTDVDLELAPGEHIAVVGPSGSGKSSLIGLLLGWHRPADGAITVDGEPLQGAALQRLRGEIAWVDPAAQIWNRSLAHNLRYGNGDVADAELHKAVALADLEGVAERLPHGLDTSLGEGGGLLSGGEGQRVRLGRALLKPGARLAILDEPFRGLDGDRRRERLAVARERWRDATLVYVSHDIDTALGFARVLVVEHGRILEDGDPTALLADPRSRLAALKDAQDALQREVWGDPVWRRWRMVRGELRAVDGEDA